MNDLCYYCGGGIQEEDPGVKLSWAEGEQAHPDCMQGRQIGSQFRQTLVEADSQLLALQGEAPHREAYVREYDQVILYTENDHVAGYALEIEGVGFEFVRSVATLPEWVKRGD